MGKSRSAYGIEVQIPVQGSILRALLEVPPERSGWVVFAHGSGSSRRSPRNQRVARALNRVGIATVLVDLLTEAEALGPDQGREQVFDVSLLAARLLIVTEWLEREHAIAGEPIAYFGASTGAAAALLAAAGRRRRISAVISRGGRPDLASPRLSEVGCPVLLIVGGSDDIVLRLNRRALVELRRGELLVVPGATHLFEEPGALESVADAAAGFLLREFSAKSKAA